MDTQPEPITFDTDIVPPRPIITMTIPQSAIENLSHIRLESAINALSEKILALPESRVMYSSDLISGLFNKLVRLEVKHEELEKRLNVFEIIVKENEEDNEEEEDEEEDEEATEEGDDDDDDN